MTSILERLFRCFVVAMALLWLASCGGGGSADPLAPAPPGGGGGSTGISVGGTVSGLTAAGLELKLQTANGVHTKRIAADGDFAFDDKIASGAAYTVTILTSPTGQACSVSNGISQATQDVKNITVTCVRAFTVGGRVNGLNGTVVLQNERGNDLTVTETAGASPIEFVFSQAVASGTHYNVTVLAQPANQFCTVDVGGSGTIDNDNASTVEINCAAPLRFRSGDVTVAPGAQETWCHFIRFPNDQQDPNAPREFIRAIRTTLPPAVKALTVWAYQTASQSAAGSLTKGACGVMEVGGAPPAVLFATGHVEGGGYQELAFAADEDGRALAYPLLDPAHAAIQMYVVNTNTPEQGPLTVHIDLEVSLLARGVARTPVGIYTAVHTKIAIPTGSPGAPAKGEFGGRCPVALPEDPPLKFFNMKMFTYSHGVRTRIMDGTRTVYEDAGWNSPAVTPVGAPSYVTFESGLLGYSCDFVNPGFPSIRAGEHAERPDEEICMAAAYYFPHTVPGLLGHACLDDGVLHH